MPESIVPFGITQQEAQERLRTWCKKNRGRKEAKQLLPLLPELKGFYLPYSLLRGPVHMKAGRIDTDVIYPEIRRNPSSVYSFLLVAGYLNPKVV